MFDSKIEFIVISFKNFPILTHTFAQGFYIIKNTYEKCLIFNLSIVGTYEILKKYLLPFRLKEYLHF